MRKDSVDLPSRGTKNPCRRRTRSVQIGWNAVVERRKGPSLTIVLRDRHEGSSWWIVLGTIHLAGSGVNEGTRTPGLQGHNLTL